MRRKRLIFVAAAVAALAGLVWAGGCLLSLKRDPRELDVGASAPSVAVQTVDGKPFALESLRAKGLPVLVFYRGHW